MNLASFRKAAVFAFVLFGAVGCKHTTADSEAALRSKLATHREQQIERLHAYAALGQFPHNFTSPTDLHMFRDAEGRYCAVANLVHQDGRDDLVEQTVREHNDLAVHDVTDGPMKAWILESGLTQEELERIQLPAMPMDARFRHPAKAAPLVAVKPVEAPKPVDAPTVHAMPVVAAERDEEALRAQVRTHLAEVEVELRAHTDASLALAVRRTHEGPATRVASR
jgi:hypothetical protein